MLYGNARVTVMDPEGNIFIDDALASECLGLAVLHVGQGPHDRRND
jgi:hypothetical protein